MNRTVLALLTALSLAGASVVVPNKLYAQDMTYAELFQSWPSGAGYVGPVLSYGNVINIDGRDVVESITEVVIGESPYPGINIELEPQDPSFPDTRFTITATGGKIYPKTFGIPFSVRINYTDGSYEYLVDEFDVWPLPSLVADNPVEPVVTNPFPTVTSTVTVTETQPTDTETVTVTAEPSVIPTSTSVTTPTTQVIETVEPIIPPVTETVTVTQAPVTVTASPSVTTVTQTKPAEPRDNSSSNSASGSSGIIGIILGILAALGLGAGGMFFALTNGLL